MTDRPRVTVDFVVIASRERLVSKEVDRFVLYTCDVLFSLNML